MLETRIGAEAPFFARYRQDLVHLCQGLSPALIDYTEDADLLDAAFGSREPRPEAFCVRVEAHSILRDAPYVVHTNVELALMLDGVKPLAVFRDHPESSVIADTRALFAPYVASNRIILVEERRQMTFDGPTVDIVDLFYHLPAEGWRVPVLRALRAQAGPWSDDAEEIEGLLLGYTSAQNAWWRKNVRRQATSRASDRTVVSGFRENSMQKQN